MSPEEAREVLDTAMGPNDANADTVGDYMNRLAAAVWQEDEGFSGKRPFGDSGWFHQVYDAFPGIADNDVQQRVALALDAIFEPRGFGGGEQ